jgi:hypothetical protein
MRPTVFVLPLLVLAPLVTARASALACSCALPPPVLEVLDRSDAVFLGEVISVEAASPDVYPSAVWAVFRVDRWWKGEPAATARILTDASSASCGFEFATGDRYLVYAIRGDAGSAGAALTTNLCWRTHRYWADDPDLAELDRVKVLGVGSPYPSPSNGAVAFRYSLAGNSRVELAIYDLRGRQVRVLEGPGTQGPHEVVWDGRDRAGRVSGAGIYVGALTIDGRRFEHRFARVR